MGGGVTGLTWENVKEHGWQTGWKDSVVEKVNCRGRRTSLTNVFIAKVINVERDTALEPWAGNSARLMGQIIKEYS